MSLTFRLYRDKRNFQDDWNSHLLENFINKLPYIFIRNSTWGLATVINFDSQG